MPTRATDCLTRPETCYCCGGSLRPLIETSVRVQDQDGQLAVIPSTLYYCKKCDMSITGVDYAHPVGMTHFDIAGYNNLEYESHIRTKRERFFAWLTNLAVKHLGRTPQIVLDFGCSYGHLLDVFKPMKADTIGIEVNSQLRQMVADKGHHQVFATIGDCTCAEASIDIILAIDSLYYHGGNPAEPLGEFYRMLRPGGLLVLRTTNRNFLHRLYASCWHLRHGQFRKPAPASKQFAGDGRFGFSQRVLTRLLRQQGFQRIVAYRREHKPKSFPVRCFDIAAMAIYYASFKTIDANTGLVLIASKPLA